LKSQFILQSVVIHLAECYGEGVLQCLGERPSVGPLRREKVRDLIRHEDVYLILKLNYRLLKDFCVRIVLLTDVKCGIRLKKKGVEEALLQIQQK
jgi:hypothetical protein